MILLALSIPIGIFAGIRYFLTGREFIDLIIGFIQGFFISLGLLFVIAWMLPMQSEKSHTTYNLESLIDGNGIQADFFLGCGTIEGELHYAFYYEHEKGYKLEKVKAEDAYVRYSDKNQMTIIKDSLTDSWINLFALDLEYEKEYIFEVPENSIKNQYKLDTQ